MDENEIEVFYNLGLLATVFAKMEEELRWILIIFIDDEDPLIGLYMLEKATLSDNLDNLKKLNDLRHFKRKEIKQIIERIQPLRSVRNSFIHGIWDKPYVINGMVFIDVAKNKVTKEENLNEDGVGEVIFSSRATETYSLNKIKEKIEEIIAVSNELKSLRISYYDEKQKREEAQAKFDLLKKDGFNL